MRMRLVLLVFGLLMAGVLVAGCGGDEEGGGGGGDTTAQTETGGGEASPEEGGGGGGDPSNPDVQQAIEACKAQVNQPGLSDEVKADLAQICEEAANGDEQQVREATREVCEKVIEGNVPEGPARDRALSACGQTGQSP